MKATFAETITTSRNCYFWDERDAALCLCSMVAALDEGLATYIILLVWGEKKKHSVALNPGYSVMVEDLFSTCWGGGREPLTLKMVTSSQKKKPTAARVFSLY